MSEINILGEAYKKAKYKAPDHGQRNVQVLKDALMDIDGEMESEMYGK